MPASTLASLLTFEDFFESEIRDGLDIALDGVQVLATRDEADVVTPRVEVMVSGTSATGQEFTHGQHQRDMNYKLFATVRTITDRTGEQNHAAITGAVRAWFSNFNVNLGELEFYELNSVTLVNCQRVVSRDEATCNDVTSDSFAINFSIKRDAWPV